MGICNYTATSIVISPCFLFHLCLFGEVVDAQGSLPDQPCGVDSCRRPLLGGCPHGSAWYAGHCAPEGSQHDDGHRLRDDSGHHDLYELEDLSRTTLNQLVGACESRTRYRKRHMQFSRRQFHRVFGSAAAVCASQQFNSSMLAEETGPLETFVPTRAITRGPLNHWFGYYDKREFDPTNRYVLSNQIDFEGRGPTGDDTIKVGYVDTALDDKWHEIGSSRAWGWQQGCMLQWVGGNGDKILWNDREGEKFVCRIYSKSDRRVRTLPRPIYTISRDGSFGLSVDFRRIDNLRPGYGYDGLADPNVANRAPDDSGIWRVDLNTGEDRLVMSLSGRMTTSQRCGLGPMVKRRASISTRTRLVTSQRSCDGRRSVVPSEHGARLGWDPATAINRSSG
jgi:hypothetical protein